MKRILHWACVLALVSCASQPADLAAHECEQIKDKIEQLSCFKLDISTLISLQIRSDFKENPEMPPYSISVLRGVAAEFNILPNGEIATLKITSTSGDHVIDDFVLHAIKRASPFELPKNTELREKLKTFKYKVTL